MNIKLAWRNLWRNRRRTFLTMASVFLAVILCTLTMSFKEGIYVQMIKSMIGAFTGYVQVHQNGYWDEKTVDNSMVFSDTLKEALENTKGVTGYLPRIESFALAASDDATKGALVVGVDPQKEVEHTQLHERVDTGAFFGPDERTALLGVGLAEYLKVGVGDTLVLLGQGYHGASAAGKYAIKGLIKFGSPQLSKQVVFLPVKEAQWLYDTENMYTSVVLLLDDNNKANKIAASLGDQLGDQFEVMAWEELAPDLKNMIETDRVEGYVLMFILYMVISFGIFGTMLMMLSERRHEFGVLVAIGMKRMKLATMVWMEVVMISIMGAFLGMLGAFPVCLYFYLNPITLGADFEEMMEDYGFDNMLPASIEPYVFFQQAAVVALVACVISIYPLIKLNRMDAMKAMRS